MSRTRRRAALAAALLGLAAHAAPLLSQEPRVPPPGRPSVDPTVNPPLTKPPVRVPVSRPGVGDPTRSEVPVVIPSTDQILEDMWARDRRAKGAAPTGVQLSAVSPITLKVSWELPACAAGSLISIGTSFGGSTTLYRSDTLPPSRVCAGGGAGKELRLADDPGAGSMTAGAATLEQTVTPLQPGRTYSVSVAAFYRDSAAGSADAVEVTMPPPPPFTITSVASSAAAVDLSWKEALRPTRYLVFRDNVEVGDAGPATSYRDNKGVKSNTSYSYRVDAVYEAVPTGQKYRAVPDVIVSATTTTETPYPPVFGFADTHTHPFADLASGGKLFFGSAFGAPLEALLVSCAASHGPDGTLDRVGNLYRFMEGNITMVPTPLGFSVIGHHTGGAPHFAGWPTWKTLNHQQMHSDWIFRAYQGGLRLMVAHALNNSLLCDLQGKAPGRTCDDMEAADLQIDAAKQMENFTDMQNGGPGEGWFRIAYTPEQARKIINDGKLAVVLGIEVDKLFGCGIGQCDSATVDIQLAKYYAKGVRHLIPVHFADNAFGGYALGGSIEKRLFELNSMAASEGGLPAAFLSKTVSNAGLPIAPTVALPKDEDCSASGFDLPCNARGLTTLGTHLITSMMNKGMIIDIDHMSKRSTDSVLVLTSRRQYPVVGGHTGFVTTSVGGHKSERDKSPSLLSAIKQFGGMVSVGVNGEKAATYVPSWRGAVAVVANDCDGTSKTFAQSYLYAVEMMGGSGTAAVGLATDQFMTEMPRPRFGNKHCPGQANPVTYPITAHMPGVTLGASRTTNREWDYNTEGLVHFGLLPDFIQDLKNDGLTDQDLAPLFRSAEGYIRMWERAVASVPVP